MARRPPPPTNRQSIDALSSAHPLRGRDFRLLYGARILSLTGDAAVPAALALAVLRATGSTSALALVLGCAMVPRLLLLPIGGVVADRLNARGVALATDLVGCAAQLFAAIELLGGRPQLYALAPWAASAWGTPTPLLIAAFLVATSCLATAAVPGVRHLTMPTAECAPRPG
ncbi:hypothetical protein ETD83_39860 [Actinomadura soli]|uniref:MFS transporter n=1 Tax=Actinomadura soli TaxID=2508997 RepID=A0A5C4IYV0_9ACTN|nr:MFS transporter [Actinomadura soli]TMQ87412.1 hypothetical protein ETD83_39860 [Actinomadura soli]